MFTFDSIIAILYCIMKKSLLFFILFITAYSHSQQEDAWVYFTGKPNAAYYLAHPLEMLTQKALNRRAAQNIPLDEKDVPIHQPYIDGITAAPGITIMAKSKWLNALHVRGTQLQLQVLQSLSYVQYIEYANRALNQRTMQPLQVNAPQNVQENYNYGTAASQIQMLNGQVLHQQGYTGQGMTIAVMDNGFPGVNTTQPFTHLLDNNLVRGGYDFVTNSANFYGGGTHGTKVLSTMAGYTEGQLVGTAPDAFYYLFITEDNTQESPVEESYWVAAAEMADSLGVDVINTSLGYFNYDNPAYSYTYADMDGQTAFMSRGAAIAFSRGMLLVTSAGNTGDNVEPHIGVPADALNTLTVGAVDPNEQYAYFSSIGPSSDGRVKPDVMAQGMASAYADVDGTITAGSGTSFSSPIMAGMVACLWQASPNRNNTEILQIIRQSADRYNNPDNYYGYGIPDFSSALQTALALAETKKEAFVLYPNPASGTINILLPDGLSSATIILYNSLGQKVLEQPVNGATAVNLNTLQSGLYTYVISSGNTAQQGKLIKQ
jgi:serine protease AprX